MGTRSTLNPVLILSASFGDGHNTAARSVVSAVDQLTGGAVPTKFADLVLEAEPVAGPWLQLGYKFAITSAPWIWSQLYRLAEILPFSDDRLLFLGNVERLLADWLGQIRPSALVTTFPIYPHLLRRIYGTNGVPFPVFTVVTDSITVNKIWISPATSHYCVPDEFSLEVVEKLGVPRDLISVTGFPVSPRFCEPGAQPVGGRLTRVLWFPSVTTSGVKKGLLSLLEHTPAELEFTIVLGRHEPRLRPVIERALASFPNRKVTVLGWCRDVPGLLRAHDLVLTKAGGATTHECFAAGRPTVITHVVPGQEEGNAQLVLRRGTGVRETDPDALGPCVRGLTEPRCWAQLRTNAALHAHPDGALAVARLVLHSIGRPVPQA